MSDPVKRILRIDASQRRDGSVSRALADALIERLAAQTPVEIDRLDLAETAIQPVDEAWIAARGVAPEDRTPEQRAVLAQSDALIARLADADVIVLATPIYNFGVPARLKAWIDMIARPRVTFRYTQNGPVGLLNGKKAYLAIASGGTAIDSEIDFATPYLRHALGFVGIDDVTALAADRGGARPDALEAAIRAIDAALAA